MLVTYVGINYGVGDILVACPLLDRVNIGVLLRHNSAERMPKDMGVRQIFRNASRRGILLEKPQQLHSGHHTAFL